MQNAVSSHRQPGDVGPPSPVAVKLLESLGIVAEVTGQRKNRSFSYQSYIALLTR
jgi:hypothetical protein